MANQKVDISKLSKLEGWNELWDGNIAPWHMSSVHQKLSDHLETVVTASEKSGSESIRFFVPLCGKTVDLKFLYDKGFWVIGCEGSEKACVEFFSENNLEFRKTENNPGFSTFETPDERLKIVCGDYFGLTQDIIGGSVDCIWDRGSFEAIDLDQRDKYSETILKLLSDKFGYLLIGSEKEFPLPTTMPHSVSYSDVNQFFGKSCTLKVLEQIVDPGKEGSGYTKENVFLLTRKPSVDDRIDYWQARHYNGESQWHQNKINDFLIKYMDLLKGDKEHVRFFLPLCGKSLDLVWLYNLGHTVVGLEGIPFVAEQVFQDAKLDYTKNYLPEIDGLIFKTKDERLTVYSCDLFKMKPDVIGKVEAVFDRGSFEAILPEDRQAYADLMFRILAPGFRYIINCYEYPEGDFSGPPRSCDRKEVIRLFTRSNGEGLNSNVTVVEEIDFTEHGKTTFKIEGSMIKLLYFVKGE